MLKYGWLFITLCILESSLFAQELPYALQQAQLPIRSISGIFPAYNINETLVDATGNTYITGYFRGSADFDPGPGDLILNSQSANVYDAFFAKYTAQGTLVYANAIQGFSDKRSNAIALTNDGKLLLGGYFLNTVNFDPGVTNFSLSANGGSDGFYARYDATTGDFEFAAASGGFGNDGIMKIVVSPTNDAYLYGYFAQTADIDLTGGVFELTAATAQDRYLAKYDASAVLQWAHPFPTLFITTLGVDASGLYAAGNFSASTDMDPGAATLTKAPAGGNDVWLSKFDASGNLLWNNVIGGSDFENVYDLVIDAAANVYLSGVFYASTDFDPSAGTTILSSLGNGDAYVAKYTTAGAFSWARGWGGTVLDQANSLVALQNNTLAIVGNFTSTSIDIDPGAGTKVLIKNAGANDNASNAYLSLVTTDGNFIEAYSYGVEGVAETAGIINGNAREFSVLGNFTQSIDFDPGADVASLPNPQGAQQAYLNRFSLLAPLPAAQPTALVLNTPTGSSINVSFTGSGANGYVVIRRSGALSTSVPKDGQTYSTGAFVADGTVAYAGAATSFVDTNLAANTSYYYSVYAYNSTGGAPNYLTSAPLTGNNATTSLTFNRTTDSLALVALYNATNGPAWTNSTNWLSSPISSWFGVTYSAGSGRVTNLGLGNNNLTGPIPSLLSNLTGLQTLTLSSNQLTGNIPSELSNLTSLLTLQLPNNDLVGNIPSELSSLPSLTGLELGGNQLVGNIPPALGSMTSLTTLILVDNLLTGSIPLTLGSLPNLTTLLLGGNQLTGTIPVELSNLSALLTLDLSINKLTGTIPAQLSNLTTLQTLRLDQNQLTGGIPIELGTLSALQNLYLNGNLLTGSIPTQLGNLSSLIFMDLGGNQLTGTIPSSLFTIPTISILGLARNQLSGAVPSQLTSAATLTTLWIDTNQLTGTFPAINSVTNPLLSAITINGNQFTDLPDVSSMNGIISYFEAANNNFTFEDLEANISIGGFSFIPQNNVGVADTIALNAGSPLNLPYTIGGSANIYSWRLNNVVQPAFTTSTLAIPAIAAAQSGNWQLSVTSSLVPGLTITSNIVKVVVKAESFFSWADGGDLTADGALGGSYSGSWGDYDNDGFEDIFTMGFSDTTRNYLYRNNGNGTFTRQPEGVIHLGTGRNVTWGDYNNDGFLDVYVPNQLGTTGDGYSAIYKNLGNGSFAKVSLTVTGTAASWADIDSDGDLDLAITATGGTEETFLRNNGNDQFEKVDNGINEDTQWTPYFVDVNNDSRLDYYITSVTSNAALTRLFMNEGGFAFYENSLSTSYTGSGPRGASWADIDNDGDYDLYLMLSNGGPENMFYINDGYGYLTEELGSTRLGEVVRGGRGSAFSDLNNDGYVDLITYQNTLLPNGWTVFLNNGNGTFTRELNQTFKEAGAFEGTSLADYDNDGFVDMMAATFTAGTSFGLYKNNGNTNHWIKIKLNGSTTNRGGIGARIAVKANGFWRHHQVLTTNGFANQNSLVAHLGLGSATAADSIVVKWPSGYYQVLLNENADQTLTISEPPNPVSDTDMEVIAAYQIRSQNAESSSSLEDFTLDATDNVLLNGQFQGTVDFDPGAGSVQLTASLQGETFIAKYLANGALGWIYTFPRDTSSNGVSHESINSTASGQVLLGGSVRGTYDVNPGTGVNNLTSNVLLQGDPYFAKYDAAGTFLWAKQLLTSSTRDAEVEAIQADAAGNILVAGQFADGTLDADPGAGTATLNSSDTFEDIFVAKYDTDGNYVWSFTIGTVGVYEVEPALVTDAQNNIYLSYNVDNFPTTQQIISKYSPTGTLLWTTTNGNTFGAGFRNLQLHEPSSRLYALGTYRGTPSFTGTSGSGTLPTSGANLDAGYVAAYDLNGAFITVYGFQTSNEVYPVSINTLDDGNLLITGGYEGTVDLDPSTGLYESYYPSSSFATKITPAGDFIWAADIPNSYGLVSELNSQNELTTVLLFESIPVDIEPGPGVINLSTLSNNEDFSIIRYDIQGGVLSADSLALEAFYNATGGAAWTNKTNWLTGNVSTWFGVTVTNDRITAINLPDNNLTGSIPGESLILNDLTAINVSGNNLVAVPDFSVLKPGVAINVSTNLLDFGSLEYNMDIVGINYADQKPFSLSAADTIKVNAGENYTLNTTVGGTTNNYQWKRNTINVATAVADSLYVESISRANMGVYTVAVTNTQVPGLTLNSLPVPILAVANLSGKILIPAGPANGGDALLLRVTSSEGYDTIQTVSVNATGDYVFNQVVLDDYQIVGFADTLKLGQERALPTYYESTIYWEEADTLFVENSLTDLNITSLLKPGAPPVGTGSIAGIVQEDDGTGEGRTEKTKRVGGAGVSARKVEATGRGLELGPLVAYVFTNIDGEFTLPNLPPGTYRINIQYPGYPMDPSSFVDIPVGSTALDENVSVEALVAEGKIVVRQLLITSTESGSYLANVHPNPSTGSVVISFEETETQRTLDLLDMQGQEIMSRAATEQSLNLEMNMLQPGLYLLKVKVDGHHVKTIRISIQR